jgi:hypothetical protein
MPFSIHLNGIASIFHQRHALQTPTYDSRELAALIGVLDLPTHSLGRQNEHLHMWRKHCMGQSGIEEVSGLPCSLLDLLASPNDDDIEKRLLQWSGEPGEPVMCKIWEATQYAGLIMVRELRSEQGLPTSTDTQSITSTVQHILVLLQDLRIRMDVCTFASTETLLFPLVGAGSQPTSLTADNRRFIRDCIVALADNSLSSYPYYEAVVLVLEALWASDGSRSLNQMTRDMDLELGLF